MSVMDINQIKSLMPHRYPFLLVDRIESVTAGKSIVGLKNVTVNEPFFSGHFPISPVMPGVLMVEALAQTSGILIFETLGKEPAKDELYYLAGIDNVRFKRMVIPGDQLLLKVEILKNRRGLWKFKGEASVNGELACTAEFMNIRGE